MTVDRNRLFEPLDPPPDGVERFRARLDAAGANGRRNPAGIWMPAWVALGARNRPWPAAAGAAAVLALAIAVVARLPFGPAPPERSDPEAATAGTTAPETNAIDPARPPAPLGSLADAPELAWLLGRASASTEVSVTVRGEPAEIVEIPSSDPRIRVYMVASGARD